MEIDTVETGRAVLEQARHSGQRAILISPSAAAGWQGIGWWRALTDLLRSENPDQDFDCVLDCGTAPGHAMEALRVGIKMVRLDASPETLRAVGEIATALGGKVLAADEPITWPPEQS